MRDTSVFMHAPRIRDEHLGGVRADRPDLRQDASKLCSLIHRLAVGCHSRFQRLWNAEQHARGVVCGSPDQA